MLPQALMGLDEQVVGTNHAICLYFTLSSFQLETLSQQLIVLLSFLLYLSSFFVTLLNKASKSSLLPLSFRTQPQLFSSWRACYIDDQPEQSTSNYHPKSC